MGPWFKRISVLIRRDSRELFALCSTHRGQSMSGHSSREETSTRNWTLLEPRSWTFHPPELWENKSLLFKPPSLWRFAREAWTKIGMWDFSLQLEENGIWWPLFIYYVNFPFTLYRIAPKIASLLMILRSGECFLNMAFAWAAENQEKTHVKRFMGFASVNSGLKKI